MIDRNGDGDDGVMKLNSSCNRYFLKEISSCGCLNTADVIYPAFPLYMYPHVLNLKPLSSLCFVHLHSDLCFLVSKSLDHFFNCLFV